MVDPPNEQEHNADDRRWRSATVQPNLHRGANMIHTGAFHRLRAFASRVLPILFVVGLLAGCTTGRPAEWDIQNPYASVNWTTWQQHKANFHTHTTFSDGRATPPQVIDAYRDLGYAILALTDHDTVGPDRSREHPERHKTTWPWEAFDRDPKAMGMVAIQGNEISRVHHTGSLFNDYGDAEVESEEAAIEQIGRRNGLAMLYHPGRYQRTVDWYVQMYRTYPHLVGLEVYNQGDRYPEDRKKWDAILTAMAGQRPVWGFSNDDMHNPATQLGRNWNIMLLPELSSEAVRQAMQNGTFFFVYAPQGHAGSTPPAIQSITVDARSGAIRIRATGHDRIEWISEGRIVHQGDQVNLGELADLGGYIRAKVHAIDGQAVVGTQPFHVQPPANRAGR
jgi:hypothetical protein